MKEKKKLIYVPPKVKVHRVVLDGVIAASPFRQVQLKDWEHDIPSDDNNADTWINL